MVPVGAGAAFGLPDQAQSSYLVRAGESAVCLDMGSGTLNRLAAILAGNAPLAMRGMKRAINEFARGKFDEEAADLRHRDSMRSAEIKEGIKAFAEKRPPEF